MGAGGAGDTQWTLAPSVSVGRRVEGYRKLVEVMAGLSQTELDRLLRFARDWNTQPRHNVFAQQVCPSGCFVCLSVPLIACACVVVRQLLNVILKAVPLATLSACPNFTDVGKAVIPYTERHFEVRAVTEPPIVVLASPVWRVPAACHPCGAVRVLPGLRCVAAVCRAAEGGRAGAGRSRCNFRGCSC